MIGCKCSACTSIDSHNNRLRSSIYIETNDCKIIIDTGPDLRQQLLLHSIDDLDAILITHEHNDHTAGLDDVRPINFKHQKTLPLFSTKRVLDNIEKRFSYIFDTNPYPGAPRIELKAVKPFQQFYIKNTEVLPIEYDHGPIKIIGFRINDMAYLTDVSFLGKIAMSNLKKLKVLIISALQIDKHYAHLSLSEAIEVSKVINADQTYLMHISHTMGPVMEWAKELPPTINAAYDGLLISI